MKKAKVMNNIDQLLRKLFIFHALTWFNISRPKISAMIFSQCGEISINILYLHLSKAYRNLLKKSVAFLIILTKTS